MSTATMVVLIGFVEAFLHYISRREVLGRDLPRPAAYVLGTLGMMGPFSWWLLEHGNTEAAETLWMAIAAGGTSVGMWYAVDWVAWLVVSLRESRQREKAALDAMQEALKHAKG